MSNKIAKRQRRALRDAGQPTKHDLARSRYQAYVEEMERKQREWDALSDAARAQILRERKLRAQEAARNMAAVLGVVAGF